MEYFSIIICRPILFLCKVNFSKLDLIFAEKFETNVQPSKNVIIITTVYLNRTINILYLYYSTYGFGLNRLGCYYSCASL